MKTRFYFFLALLSFSFINNESTHQVRVHLTAESFLYIKGTSNINTFTCVYDAKTLSRKIPVTYTKSSGSYYFENVSLQLKNDGFNCGNKMINKDFHDLLQTETFPSIQFQLNELIMKQNQLEAKVTLQIAGIKKQYSVPVKTHGELAPIEGLLCLNITDFGLTPPKKMMGMIVVKEDIEIVFGFDLQILDNH
ncbi:YceI family protein [uncultured Planktosalinus sp.]|uniref:YceI family protein n=1 Tax=uncultured Planktosalinus sp. TaxID=1810935 RepID=UPI0030D86878